ncbi:hypothetical protein IU501_03255 [Nocardia otitidiscaviarum]|nr:hypothetical protein [Nocardia otitidiscaviarum]
MSAFSKAVRCLLVGCATISPTMTGPAPVTAAPVAELSANAACGWSPRIGAGTLNIAYPDTFANYWVTFVPAVPGTTLTIRGTFPHARYMSFTAYTRRGHVSGALNDQLINADPAGVNPFVDGADRNAASREYTIRVVVGETPPQPEPNTLHTGDSTGFIPVVYRVYRPDAGSDATGGAGLPRLTVISARGSRLDLSDCAATETPFDPHVTFPPSRLRYPSLTQVPKAPDWQSATGGGYFPNPDNKYLATLLDPGRVAVVRGKLPTAAPTHQGQPTMRSGEVRYWSLCTNNPISTAVTACVVDDELAIDAEGRYTVVVSSSADRPTGFTDGCGIGWLPTDGGSDLLIMRNLLPDSDFAHSIQAADPAAPRATLGPYYPEVQYESRAEVESWGCTQ